MLAWTSESEVPQFFGPVRATSALGDHTSQLAVLVRFATSDDGDPSALVDELEFNHTEPVAEDGRRWDLYVGYDSALLFRSGTVEIVGHALQHGFVSPDREPWTALDALEPDALRKAGFMSRVGFDLMDAGACSSVSRRTPAPGSTGRA